MSKKQKPLGAPPFRRPFVTRAAYLTTHPPFRAALDQEIRVWNREFPDFAVGSRDTAPEHLLRVPSDTGEVAEGDIAYPPALERALASLFARPRRSRLDDPLDETFRMAMNAWRHRVRRL